MKKFLALLMAVALLVTFTACDNDTSGDDVLIDNNNDGEWYGDDAYGNGAYEGDNPDGILIPDDESAEASYLERVFSQLIDEGFFNPPYMMDIFEDRLGQYNVEPADAVEFIAKEAAISAIFVQLIVIKAKEDRVNEVHNAMILHQESLRDAAFYPQGVSAAAASIVGVSGNIVYMICDERAQEIEELLLNIIT